MQKSRLVTLILVLGLLALGTIAHGQITPLDSAYAAQFNGMYYDRVLAKVCEEVKYLNRVKYPNPDLVNPGDTLQMPLGQIHVVEDVLSHGRHDCMWDASEHFMWSTIFPIQQGTYRTPQTVTAIPETVHVAEPAPADRRPWFVLYWYWIVIGFLVIALLVMKNRRQDQSNAFVERPPHFANDPDTVVRPTAEAALHRVYGRNIRIVGDIERGYINGEQIVFFSDGTTQRQVFANEPGYRTTIEFPDGTRRQVVSRWSCFNPLNSAIDAQHKGTFRAEGSDTAQEIPAISVEQIAAVSGNITGSEQQLTADDVPGAVKPFTDKTDDALTTTLTESAPVQPVTEPTMHFTKIQMSKEKGINLEGEIDMTVAQLHDLAYQFTGRRPEDGKPKADKPAETVAPTAQVESSAGAPNPAS